jgi:hypothetical protein
MMSMYKLCNDLSTYMFCTFFKQQFIPFKPAETLFVIYKCNKCWEIELAPICNHLNHCEYTTVQERSIPISLFCFRYFNNSIIKCADHSGRTAWNVFVHSNTGIVGSNPTGGMDVCLRSVFVLSCVGSGLESGWSPVQGVLPTVYMIHNFRINSEWEQAREPNPSR